MRFQSFDVTPAEPFKLHGGGQITHKLFPGQTLVLTPDDQASGHYVQIETNPGDPSPNTRGEVEGKTTVGPFTEQRAFRVHCTAGAMRVDVHGKRRAGD